MLLMKNTLLAFIGHKVITAHQPTTHWHLTGHYSDLVNQIAKHRLGGVLLFIKGRIMRKTLFKWHSISALIALIPIMIIAVTGSILVFKVEIDTWLMPAHMQVEYTEQTPRLNFNELIENIEAKHPEFLMGSW